MNTKIYYSPKEKPVEYDHKGITITFAEGSGEFMATVGKDFMSSGSLSGIKKKIDKHLATLNAFTPVKAITGYLFEHKHPLKDVMVVGVVKSKRTRWTVEHKLKFDDGNEWFYAYEDTPQNRDAIKALRDHEAESQAIRNARDAEKDTLLKAIKFIRPEQFPDFLK